MSILKYIFNNDQEDMYFSIGEDKHIDIEDNHFKEIGPIGNPWFLTYIKSNAKYDEICN